METKLFELLEEKIDKVLDQVQALSRENQDLKQKMREQDKLVEQARSQMDGFEEGKQLIRNKLDGILKKITQVVD